MVKDPDKELVASVLTMFANGSTVADICRAHNICYWTANKMIDRYWMPKKITELTNTITLHSKI